MMNGTVEANGQLETVLIILVSCQMSVPICVMCSELDHVTSTKMGQVSLSYICNELVQVICLLRWPRCCLLR